MKADSLRIDRWALVALVLAWLGIWGAWIPHKTVALTQNAVDLAEWATFLTDVRYGSLRLMPELLRLSVSLSVVALAVAAGSLAVWWQRWLLRLAALIPGLMLLPPYPFILHPMGSGYEIRLLIALVMWLGVALTLLTDRLGGRLQRILAMGMAGAAVITGLRAYGALHSPFVAHYNQPLLPGWGLIVFAAGLTGAVLLEVWAAITYPPSPA
jgi:hypothetical protein